MVSMQKLEAICFVLLCFSMFGLNNGSRFGKPPNCEVYVCPPYKVIETSNDFEIRTYDEAIWASGPAISSQKFEPAGDAGFRILFDYFNRTNEEGVLVNLTAPVLVEVSQGSSTTTSSSSSSSSSWYKLYFYVEPKFQNNPPRPTSNQVKLVKLPLYKYAAVRRFEKFRFIDETSIPIELSALKDSLKGTSWAPAITSPGPYMLAAYNEPDDDQNNRVNEAVIWFNL